MTNERKAILDEYLKMSKRAQEIEYYIENTKSNQDRNVFKENLDRVIQKRAKLYQENNITRRELDEYKNPAYKAKSTEDVLNRMEKFFS